MSRKNGDKARCGKEQQKKLLRRKRNRALRQSLASLADRPEPTCESAVIDTAAKDDSRGNTDAVL